MAESSSDSDDSSQSTSMEQTRQSHPTSSVINILDRLRFPNYSVALSQKFHQIIQMTS